ncbi:twin-arginine translocation signal domain-containing protein [Streptomyces sp. NPDC079167]|uniref:twin-arginine translocation signal domain-containing protein n=1 Tax=Streptomyces sp. NPDC079167 TaxID=3154513 RepID=UPI00343E38CD
MDRRTFLTAAGTGAAALSAGALTAPDAVAVPAGGSGSGQLHAWFRDRYRI